MMYDAYHTFIAVATETSCSETVSSPIAHPYASRQQQIFSSECFGSMNFGYLSSGRSTHIPRKYKWNGELCINTEKGQKERVCNVSLSDSSEGSTDRLRFAICFNSSVSSLLLEKLFSLAELQCLRPALTHVAEVAKLGPESEADTQPLNALFIHMSSRKLARTYSFCINKQMN